MSDHVVKTPEGRTRLRFQADIEALGSWAGTTPEVHVEVHYDPGDRERAIDLLQGIVDTARAEVQS